MNKLLGLIVLLITGYLAGRYYPCIVTSLGMAENFLTLDLLPILILSVFGFVIGKFTWNLDDKKSK